MDILLGIFLILIGISIAFTGIQVFFVMLPLVGLVTGFYVGAQLVASIFGDGFLGTVTGWIVGIVVGLAFAAIARYWWYAGVLVSSAMVGALLLTGIGTAFGVTSGWILFILGAAGGAALMLATLMLNLPVYMVIVNTALSGSAIAIAGAMLMFNQITRDDLAEGAAFAAINESWLWVLVWAVVSGIGIARQLPLKERVNLPVNRWAPAT